MPACTESICWPRSAVRAYSVIKRRGQSYGIDRPCPFIGMILPVIKELYYLVSAIIVMWIYWLHNNHPAAIQWRVPWNGGWGDERLSAFDLKYSIAKRPSIFLNLNNIRPSKLSVMRNYAVVSCLIYFIELCMNVYISIMLQFYQNIYILQPPPTRCMYWNYIHQTYFKQVFIKYSSMKTIWPSSCPCNMDISSIWQYHLKPQWAWNVIKPGWVSVYLSA